MCRKSPGRVNAEFETSQRLMNYFVDSSERSNIGRGTGNVGTLQFAWQGNEMPDWNEGVDCSCLFRSSSELPGRGQRSRALQSFPK